MGKSKIQCSKCQKKCSGEVLRVSDRYFHKTCFQCTKCNKSLATGGFFSKDGLYYCTLDYQKNFGTKCAACNQYVEGEVVSTMGNTYHQKCFTCSKCKQPFKSGSKVTNTGKEVLCEGCVKSPPVSGVGGGGPATSPPPTQVGPGGQGPSATVSPKSQQSARAIEQKQEQRTIKEFTSSPTRAATLQHHQETVKKQQQMLQNGGKQPDPNECAGCRQQLKEGQALIALDRQWHIWCFKCNACGTTLNGEYMGKDGVPYCEKDFQKSFGVKCAHCNRYISGKVLQAGDNHHFHPTCARCTKCGDPFGDGEEMYLQGGAIWHPRCGPGPSSEGGILNGVDTNGFNTETEFDRTSTSAMSEIQFTYRSQTPSVNGSVYSPYTHRKYHRTTSPGLILREYKNQGYEDVARIYTYSYLTEEPGYLRRPIEPYDRAPVSPHFHRPVQQYSTMSSGTRSGSGSRSHSRSRSAMKVLVDSIRSETPRPKSPGMNNEEPIELSHYPAAKKPPPGEKPKIERDDFPAPPYPYTDPERRRRYSDSYKGVPESDDEVDHAANNKENVTDKRHNKEEEELRKLKSSGMGTVILKDLQEKKRYEHWKQENLDPRNASRTPSAAKEPTYRMRYESPVGASPSRNLDHQKPFYEEEFERSTSYRGSVGRAIGNATSYNVVSSLRQVPKPGYGLAPRSHTFSSATSGSAHGVPDFSFSGLGDKTHSTEFSCGKSDISGDSITDGDRRALGAEIPASSTYSGALSYHYPQQPTRRSLPNMAHSMLVHEPAKIYPYHLLLITNYRLPSDVDRCNLERHLSDVEFEAILQFTRSEFYRLPQWKRNDIKRRARLF
ncbi:actin-binding LIM protein 3-like isoform X1 [Anopheles albimanus]|uniref:actin-binding LIM protein 3-like isoform X1 n=1 Tax=Anopheles albimanus TaxID=7167 RepID=UPI00163F1F0B|nr:actin-binding LIM protein 3-like isoform X1 [Anopheles albimanus]XP_035784475.1 actin-binding LIM protein 3-like isoform X1 [Anopheles albimanus]